MKYFYLVFLTMSFATYADTNVRNFSALNFLSLDNFDNNQKHCSLSKEESQAMLNLIHAKTDELAKKIDLKKISKEIINCKKDCTCDFYSTIISSNSDLKDANKYLAILEKQKLSEKDKLVCKNKAKSICKTDFFKKMKKELKDFLPAEGAK